MFKNILSLKTQIENRLFNIVKQKLKEELSFNLKRNLKDMLFSIPIIMISPILFYFVHSEYFIILRLSILFSLLGAVVFIYSFCQLEAYFNSKKTLRLVENLDIPKIFELNKLLEEKDQLLLTSEEVALYTQQKFNSKQLDFLTKHISNGKKLDWYCFLELEDISTESLLNSLNLMKEQKSNCLNQFFDENNLNLTIKNDMNKNFEEYIQQISLSNEKELEMNSQLKNLL